MSIPRTRPCQGFTLLELLVAIGIVGVLVALLLSAIQSAREAGRRMQCASNLKNLSLGLTNYQASFGVYPAMGRPIPSTVDDSGEVTLAWTTSVLPYIEALAAAQSLQQQIDAGTLDDPWDSDDFYRDIYPDGVLACPADLRTSIQINNVTGHLSYRASLGDLIENNHRRPENIRGMFGYSRGVRPAHVTDGLSNTILLVEMAAGLHGGGKENDPIGSILMLHGGQAFSGLAPADCVAGWLETSVAMHLDDEIPGTRWADGRPYYAGAVIALPPNGRKCGANLTDQTWGIYTASSRHAGGCFVAFADGSVRFVTNSIDTGELAQPSPQDIRGRSPYGVWGALGTRAGGEADASK